MSATAMLLVLVGILVVALVFLARHVAVLSRKHRELSEEHERTIERFRPVVDMDAEKQRVLEELRAERHRIEEDNRAAAEKLAAERTQIEEQKRVAASQLDRARSDLNELVYRIDVRRKEMIALDEEANLREFGFYKPRYAFAGSERYEAELERIRDRQKQMLKDKTAAVCEIEWAVNGDKAEGRKQTNRLLKLMLRAFNGECDAATAKVKYSNIHVMEARIEKAYDAINSLAEVQQARIASEYMKLKLDELHLAHEYQEKVQDEKEEQRRIKEQIREEEQARRELERAQLEAEREERRYEQALEKARDEIQLAQGAKHDKLTSQIAELERMLAEAHANKERAIARAQLTRSGHVYVISNIGSFGEHVYKIGMTRRLDPMDRVRELGDASVPFEFDVHAIIYTEDAPALEATLHRRFGERRVNRVNERKEFFQVRIDEIANAVRENHGEIELTMLAEAAEYRKTLAILREEAAKAGASKELVSVA